MPHRYNDSSDQYDSGARYDASEHEAAGTAVLAPPRREPRVPQREAPPRRFARASIEAGDLVVVLPINPSSVQWSYTQNAVSRDTIGGRVVQLLSVRVDGLSVEAAAGSRGELQRVATGLRDVMNYHVQTQRPARFRVPSRRWDFLVYVQSVPQLGWEVASTSYPYQIQMAVEEEVEATVGQSIGLIQLGRLARGIGYNPSVHGGDAEGFAALVRSILAARGTVGGGISGLATPVREGIGGAPTEQAWGGTTSLWAPRIARAPWEGATLADQIRGAWAAAFGPSVAATALCIARCESGGCQGLNPRAINSYVSERTGQKHYVYGLYQISDIHSSKPWWPRNASGTNGGLLFDPEYNTRSAMQVYLDWGSSFEPWTVYTNGKCR